MDEELIGRIRARLARDDGRRTGDGDYLRLPEEIRARDRAGQPFFVRPLTASIQKSAIAELKPLKPIAPLGEAAVAKVEKALGLRLPDELRRLYREIGDGGFGPYGGIRRLANWARDYAKLRAELPAERGREWPEALLPIVYRNGRRFCVDRESGAVLLWTKPPKRISEKKWLASFVPQSPSLAEWLERWVDTPTEAEGGPEGGWTPPEQEIARRGQIERERAERDARERTVAPAELPPLDPGLVERIRARALSPDRRTYMAEAAERSRPVDLEYLTDGIAANLDMLPPTAAAGLSGLLKVVGRLGAATGLRMPGMAAIDLGPMRPGMGAIMMARGAGGKLGAPATQRALERAEERLGLALPAPLRQLYRIADGGFGPGDTGLFSLKQLTERYRKKCATPEGPGDEPWPARLLPLYEEDPALGCLDLETGRIVVYDVQEMDYVSSQQWRRAFGKGPESVAALMADWLGEPTFYEEHGERLAS